MMKLLGSFWILLTTVGFAIGGGGPSDQPIGITPPNLPGGQIAVDAPPGPFFDGFSPPFPTDAWWSGFTVGNQNADVAGPFPFQCQTTNEGLNFGISDTRRFDGTSIHVDTQHDWNVGIEGLPNNLNNRKATAWDSIAVSLQYFNGQGGTLDTYLVPGSPYMTFKITNAALVMNSSGGDITNFEWVSQGRKAKVTNANGVYIIYIVDGFLDLTAGTTTLTSGPTAGATIRIAKLKEANQEAILDAHVNTYPTGVDFRYNVQDNTATVTWTWDVVGDATNLLILSWPHHRQFLQGAEYVNFEYLTLKGPMRGVKGQTWTQQYSLPTVNWFPENPVHSSCLTELTKTLESEIDDLTVMIPGDFYFWGGAFGRVAQLATISEHIGRPDLTERVITILKESMAYWFDPTHVPAAAFETAWGGFINKEGWNNTWVDFGNAYYNDHHFHYGYILHGAAVIGKYDPAWLNQNLDFLTHIARDYGNPSPNDPHYAVTRHMDFFAGHSWASGIANGAGPRDQESSGEAINGYYGLLLFAHASNDQALIDYSRLLLAIEISGAKAYWHLYPNAAPEDTPYPEKPLRDLTTIGNVMDTQAGAWLFWGAERTQIAAIQILPLTPMGQETYDVEWMEGVLPYCQEELDDVNIGDDFKSVIYAAYAKVNPQEAYLYSTRLSSWGSGNSASNQLYFVSTQPSAGEICSAAAQTPEGLFTIEDVTSGLFITSGANGALAATTNADVLATKFNLKFKPGGSTIQSMANNQFVSASPDGAQPLAANRQTAGSYEVFRWTDQGDGYTLVAMVNRAGVTTEQGNGRMFNNANSTNGITPSVYRLHPSDDNGPIVIPEEAALQSTQNNRFVLSTAGDPGLKTIEADAGTASRWKFEKIPESPESSPYYAIQNVATGQYVTANLEGTAPLQATAPVPQAWEHFQIVPYQGAYLLLHVASGHPVAVQADDTLLNNSDEVNAATTWQLVQ